MKDKDTKMLVEAYGSIYNNENIKTELKNMATYILNKVQEEKSNEFDIPSLIDELTDWLREIGKEAFEGDYYER